ncbi:MAG: peptidase M22 [Oscillospiraceae bacterium]|jgi:N6-L-threonylcarbamoyladenine synthase|nr:peptidase M22 [Oscillospiraceae bacterium]
MPLYLGIDTSNYTTSAALLESRSGTIRQFKIPLPVKEGELGLRQSDAVFHHTIQLPQALETLLIDAKPDYVAASEKPRDAQGSYMPCFMVGAGSARSIAAACGVPVSFYSHQAGHIAAALYSANRLDLFEREFIAFHVSGGTTEAVLVTPNAERGFNCRLAAASLDLKGGQAVDRVGLMLGLRFPAGAQLEALALRSQAAFNIKPSMKGADCSLSGIENKCKELLNKGSPPEDIALFCLVSIQEVLAAMATALLAEHPNLPLVFAGGVMSNSIIRKSLESRFNAHFAAPEFSADNAAGIALLARGKR